MRSTLRRTVALSAVTAALVFAACGDDDGADVRSLGGDDPSGVASGDASGSGSGAAAAEKECEPVGTDLEDSADTAIDIGLDEYGFDPAALELEAGVVKFDVTNNGEEAHELAFLPGGGDVPLTADGDPDEDALEEMGAFELEAFGPGQECDATYRLEAGDYTIFCIVEAEDGETHASKGMVGSLSVS